jgi:hypothetical protein
LHELSLYLHPAAPHRQSHTGTRKASHRPTRRIVAAVLLLVLAATLTPTVRAPTPPTGQYFDHVVTIMLENVGLADICGFSYPCNNTATSAPYLKSLANNNSLAQFYSSVKNPPTVANSLPNYLAITGGQTAPWMNTDCNPSHSCNSTSTNIVDRLEGAGLSWTGWAENYPVPSGCYLGNDVAPYIQHHFPFVYYTDITGSASRCNSLQNAGTGPTGDTAFLNFLNSSSPSNYIWLTPNGCDDGHNQCPQIGNVATSCPASPPGGYICQQEAYLKQIVPQILRTTMFTQQRSVLFVTYDEGGNFCPATGSSPDCVYAVLAGNNVKTHFTNKIAYTHYSLLGTVENNWLLACLVQGNDCPATQMQDFFQTVAFTGGGGGRGPLEM